MLDKDLEQKIWSVSDVFQSEDIDKKPLTRKQRQEILFVLWKLTALLRQRNEELANCRKEIERLKALIDTSK